MSNGLDFRSRQQTDGTGRWCDECNETNYVNEFRFCPKCWSEKPESERLVLTGENVRVQEVRVEVERHDHYTKEYRPVPNLWEVMACATLLGAGSGMGGAYLMLRYGVAWIAKSHF